MEKINELVDKHWKYVEGILIIAAGEASRDMFAPVVKEIEYHYKTAFKHGYKHGREDFRDQPTTP